MFCQTKPVYNKNKYLTVDVITGKLTFVTENTYARVIIKNKNLLKMFENFIDNVVDYSVSFAKFKDGDEFHIMGSFNLEYYCFNIFSTYNEITINTTYIDHANESYINDREVYNCF